MPLKEKLRPHWRLILLVTIVALYVGLSYWLPVKCPIRRVTGISCPGCGITRAVKALCKLDFAKAWNCNPMIYYLIAVAPVLLISYLRNWKKLTDLLLLVTAVLMIAVYLCRLMIFHSPALVVNPAEGLLAELFRFLQGMIS